MNDAQIREAACAAYDAAKQASGSWMDGFEAIYRAGLAAGRAEAQRARGSLAAQKRRLESDPVDAAKFLAEVDTRGALKPKRAKKAESDTCLVNVAEMMRYGVEPVQAESWLRARKAKRLPLTRAAWEQAKVKAERAGITVCRLVEICAGEGWAGFNAEWAIERGLLPRRSAVPAEPKREREARERVQRIAPGAASPATHGVIDLYDDASIKRID